MHLITNTNFPWAQKVCTATSIHLVETDEEITEDVDSVSCKKCLEGLGEYYVIKILNKESLNSFVYDIVLTENGLVSGSCTDIFDALPFPTFSAAKSATEKILNGKTPNNLFILKVSILPATE